MELKLSLKADGRLFVQEITHLQYVYKRLPLDPVLS
jgi:hypothetical protein